jgi:hypothetical protein
MVSLIRVLRRLTDLLQQLRGRSVMVDAMQQV